MAIPCCRQVLTSLSYHSKLEKELSQEIKDVPLKVLRIYLHRLKLKGLIYKRGSDDCPIYFITEYGKEYLKQAGKTQLKAKNSVLKVPIRA